MLNKQIAEAKAKEYGLRHDGITPENLDFFMTKHGIREVLYVHSTSTGVVDNVQLRVYLPPKPVLESDCFKVYERQFADYKTQSSVLDKLGKILENSIKGRSSLSCSQAGDTRTGELLYLPCELMDFDSENLDDVLLALSSIKK